MIRQFDQSSMARAKRHRAQVNALAAKDRRQNIFIGVFIAAVILVTAGAILSAVWR